MTVMTAERGLGLLDLLAAAHLDVWTAAVGHIAGREVRCMPLTTQFHTHKGYLPRPKDHHDLELLQGLADRSRSELPETRY